MRILQLSILSVLLFFPFSVKAENQAMAQYLCEGLGVTISSTVLDLSSSCGNSFGGSGQTWKNLESTPADSSSQSYYDFYRGSSSAIAAADPTHNGLGGKQGNYWSLDGGDYFAHTAGSSPTSFLADMHREGVTSTWTINVAMKFIHNGAATQWISGTSSASTIPGYSLQVTTADALQLSRKTGAPLNTNNQISTGITLVSGTNYLISFTFNSSTMAWKASVNGATYTASGTGTTLTNNNLASTGTMAIASANASATAPLVSGSYVYECSIMNAIQSDANLASVAAIYEARTGLDLTP